MDDDDQKPTHGLTLLAASLPPFVSPGLPIEDQARAVLNLLDPHAEAHQIPTPDPGRCPNCDAPVANVSTPYCSKDCRDQAAFVRQFRAALASGAILDPGKQLVFGERLWWLLGGGLPLRESRIPESAKRQVIKRSEGKCESCGRPMDAIQNFGSGCNRPLHLRAVCATCSRTKPYGDESFAQSPAVVAKLSELSQRINAKTPTRPCDDPETWDWRLWIAQRKV